MTEQVTKHQLIYFPLPYGKAFHTHIMLALSGIDYDWKKVTFAEWRETKTDPKYTFGQLPILILPDGRTIAQSFAISYYAAAKGGFLFNDPAKDAAIMSLCFTFDDFHNALLPSLLEFDMPKRIEMRKEIGATKLPEMMARLESFLKRDDASPYAVGDRLSLGDVAVFGIHNLLTRHAEHLPSTLVTDYPTFAKVVSTVASDPRVAVKMAELKSVDEERLKALAK